MSILICSKKIFLFSLSLIRFFYQKHEMYIIVYGSKVFLTTYWEEEVQKSFYNLSKIAYMGLGSIGCSYQGLKLNCISTQLGYFFSDYHCMSNIIEDSGDWEVRVLSYIPPLSGFIRCLN